MSSILSDVSTIFSSVMEWLNTLVVFIAGGTIGSGSTAVEYDPQPLLLLFIILPIAFLGVTMLRKLLRL